MKSVVWVVLAAVVLGGCAPCWYKGKAISREDAEAMRKIGMEVECR